MQTSGIQNNKDSNIGHIYILRQEEDDVWDLLTMKALQRKLAHQIFPGFSDLPEYVNSTREIPVENPIVITNAPLRRMENNAISPLEIPNAEGKDKFYEGVISLKSIIQVIARPEAFFIICYEFSQTQLQEDLQSWLGGKDYLRPKTDTEENKRQLPTKYQNLLDTSNTHLLRSFICLEDIVDKDKDLKDLADFAGRFHKFALYDPTGLRKFFQYCLTKTQSPRSLSGKTKIYPPHYALVVDDDQAIARYHAYLLYRMGYSVIIASECADLKYVDSSEITFDLYAVDQGLYFHDWPKYKDKTVNYGDGASFLKSRCKDEESSTRSKNRKSIKLLITGGNHNSDRCFTTLHKPIVGLYQFIEELEASKVSKTLPADKSLNVLPLNSNLHQTGIGTFRKMTKQLIIDGSKLVDNKLTWEACVHWLDAYEIIKGRDGVLAMESFYLLQEQEVKATCNYYTAIQDKKPWALRFGEIRNKAKSAFVQDDTYASKKINTENSQSIWWQHKLLTMIHRIMISEEVPMSVRIIAVHEIRNTIAAIWQKEPELHYRVKVCLLKAWNSITFNLNSLSKILMIWVGWLLISCLIYLSVFNIKWKKALIITMHQGVGLDFNGSDFKCHPFLFAIHELLNGILTLFIIAWIVDHFMKRISNPNP